jgi:hypothetical protein
MRPALIGAAAIAACALLATTARAADTDTDADVRCVVVAMALTQSADDQARAFAQPALIYFQGRIDGRSPNFDLEPAIIKAVQTMSAASYTTEAARCGAILMDKGQKLHVIGDDLKQKAKSITPPAAGH